MNHPTHVTNLTKYAEVIVKIGLNLQPGQRLLIRTFGPVETVAPLVRQVSRCAYETGARLVEVIWSDEEIDQIRFETAALESFSEISGWTINAAMSVAEHDDAYLTIYGTDPDATADVDPAKIGRMRKAIGKKGAAFTQMMTSMDFNWCIAGAANAKWAAKIFPDKAAEEQLDCLWAAIFDFARVTQPDPIAAWKSHLKNLEQRQQHLNQKQYHALHFRGPGTDLTVGLVKDHIWISGATESKSGSQFVINIPTEEIFTMPDANRVDGEVRASMPLNVNGTIIKDLWFKIKNGKIVDFDAKSGKALLSTLLESDAGAKRLGEVALVPQSSPIARRNTLFYHTLFDENASNHVALGRAYPITIKNGTSLSPEELAAAGGNISIIHIDFMIGSTKMTVDGITSDGKREGIMTNGDWSF
ncbi:MAG: aminopeptidase [Chloroflexota bacterium]